MAKGLPRRRAAIACRFGQAFIHPGQSCANDDGHKADAKCDMGQRHRSQPEGEIQQDEENEQGDAHQDLRNRDRRQDQDR